MLQWLRGVASSLLGMFSEGCTGTMLSMPIEHQYPHHGPLVTPLGTRNVAWLQAVQSDPGHGIDLFPWWPRGLGPSFRLGRALCRMWQSIRWRAPLTADETTLLQSVHADLTKAFRQDARLSYPWREWREVLDLLRQHVDKELQEEIDRRATSAGDGPRIGYRRLPVRVALGAGWSLEIPGAMAEQWDEDGTWSAWDGHTTVWFSSFTLNQSAETEGSRASPLDAMDWPEGERFRLRADELEVQAVFGKHEEDGERGWRLHGRAGTSGNLAIVDIFLKNPSDREAAVDICKSIQKT